MSSLGWNTHLLEEAYQNFVFTWAQAGVFTLPNVDKEVIVLLAGGSKRTQKSDIKRAKDLAAQLV